MTLKNMGAPMSLVLPFSPASAAVARRRLGRWLEELEGGPARDACALVVSELVGNAVRHARPLGDGTIEVSWRLADDGVEIAVSDGGSISRPHKVDAGLSSLSGRGIAIIEALAGHWWVDRGESRTTVHAVIASQVARTLSLV